MILFQLYFDVTRETTAQFLSTYDEVFLPALRRQRGFRHAKLLCTYDADVSTAIGAATNEFNYQVNFVFETEDLRRRWSVSADHDVAWPKLASFARKVAWRGFDLLADTQSA
jgi:hypothetical protein